METQEDQRTDRRPLRRLKRSDTTEKRKALLVLDLFAGAGGLSEGFVQAGCEIVGHVEMDKSSCETLRTRAVYHALNSNGRLHDYKSYILGRVSRSELIEKHELQREVSSVICQRISNYTYLELIKMAKKMLGNRRLDIIVGGPPCQAYSYIGRACDKQNMQGDERNYLYRYYVEFIRALKPRVFVFENVPGLTTAASGSHLHDMRSAMEDAGYKTDYDILNAAEFGVPQNRRRVLLVGWSGDSGISAYPEFKRVKRSYKVWDFMSDLPSITSGNQSTLKRYAKKSALLESMGIRDTKLNVLFDHITRPHNPRDLAIYRRAVGLKNSGKNLRYDQLPDYLKTHKNTNGFLDRFKVVDRDALGSHTVIAHISKDGNHYIHPDIKQNRSLSVREAARLQTFPDNYKFEGSITSKFKQIGNAVPPMLSTALAKSLLGGVQQ